MISRCSSLSLFPILTSSRWSLSACSSASSSESLSGPCSGGLCAWAATGPLVVDTDSVVPSLSTSEMIDFVTLLVVARSRSGTLPATEPLVVNTSSSVSASSGISSSRVSSSVYSFHLKYYFRFPNEYSRGPFFALKKCRKSPTGCINLAQ